MNENPLGVEKIPTLLRKFALPSITAMLVSSLYNIVDQVFIGQGVGIFGQRRYQRILSPIHHLSGHFFADWHRKRFSFFPIPGAAATG